MASAHGKSVASSHAEAKSQRTYRRPAGQPAPKPVLRPGAAKEAREELEAERKAPVILARPSARAFSLFKCDEPDEAGR